MDLSVFLAQLLSALYLAVGIGMFLKPARYRSIYEEVLRNPALLYFSGIFALAMGFIVVRVHNVWTQDWRPLVTIIGWVALFKGIVLVIWPELLAKQASFWMKQVKVVSVVALSLSVLLGYFGYFVG